MITVLGIDTSCDDTGVGIVRCAAARRQAPRDPSPGEEPLRDAAAPVVTVLANVVRSQTALHARFGGVVPEQASREHLDVIDAVVSEALDAAGLALPDIDAVAATRGPGLVGALLVGLGYGKALAWARGISFVPVHHLRGHIAAAVSGSDLEPPFLCLIASGGHTSLFLQGANGVLEELGHSLDDAAGEAFDKVARLLGLPYPGGPALAALAESGDPTAVALPAPLRGRRTFDFSFSGLKTAVAVRLEREPDLAKADVAAAFQEVVVTNLVDVVSRAARERDVHDVVVAGGVAANARLREAFASTGLNVAFPPLALSTDNGAMIALAAARQLVDETATARTPFPGTGERPDPAVWTTDATPYLPLADTAASGPR